MREIKQSIYMGETENEDKPRPQPLQHEDINQPFQTVQCTPTITHTPYISFFENYLSWRFLNGLEPSREFGLRDCIPGTLDNGRRREKRRSRRELRYSPQDAVPTVTRRAISIPDLRKSPSRKCPYDPKHMRAKSDAYQGIIYRIRHKYR